MRMLLVHCSVIKWHLDDEFERVFVPSSSLLLLLHDAHILVIRSVRILLRFLLDRSGDWFAGLGSTWLLSDGSFTRCSILSRIGQIGRSLLTDGLLVDAASTATTHFGGGEGEETPL
ncbi:hypothetical protein PENTCL1PPCAC_6708 [Pristionchus entomophagus]|uniref:G protein-coupled receptor n=1 Tax=Pristionchus entomophagus TaxID=358040 RepID=A0AAV5SQY0_9BILA|nr:hypothetical protein PENTCL1PPCAC_6708 [Pristionchus entomophagus]